MAKSIKRVKASEPDLNYFLKLLMYFVLSAAWLKYDTYVVFPIGAALAALVIHRDQQLTDRKVEFAVILFGAVLGLAGWGFFITL